MGEGWGQWLQSDLASWLAVVLAMTAIYFALRKGHYCELIFTDLSFNEDGGPISLELNFCTHSHALGMKASARLKIDGIDYPMKLELPIKTPKNFQFATMNTFHIRFSGEYAKREKFPMTASIDVKVRQRDGSRARLCRKFPLDRSEDSTQQVPDKEDSRT